MPKASNAQHVEIEFGIYGTVTVTADVSWLDLPDVIFIGIRSCLEQLQAVSERLNRESKENPS